MGDHFGTQGDAGKGLYTDAAKRQEDSNNSLCNDTAQPWQIMHSDWLNLVTWIATTNQRASITSFYRRRNVGPNYKLREPNTFSFILTLTAYVKYNKNFLLLIIIFSEGEYNIFYQSPYISIIKKAP